MSAPLLLNEDRFLGDLDARLLRIAGLPGVALLALGGLAAWFSDLSWERFLRAYLVAFCFVLSLSLGGLFFTMLQHLTRAGWSVVLRRICEGLAANLRWIWILFLPIAVGLFTSDLYPWADPEHAGELGHKTVYLNKTFWLIRAAFYFVVWAALARYFLRRSVEQDESGDPQLTRGMQAVAAPGMILYALTQTFAIVDWVMSIEPHWYSTIFGVYFFAASCCGFAAMIIIVVYLLQRSGRLHASISTEHYHDLGKFLFAFGIVFWAYIAYSQYMLIWYGNLPEETQWFLARQLGSWGTLSFLLIVGHFAVPFLVLISRWPKRWPGLLAVACVWMLVIHYLDMYWLAAPAVPAELLHSVATHEELIREFREGLIPGTDITWQQRFDLRWHLADAACVLGLTGIFIAATARGLRGVPLVPRRDPRLEESLAFENY